MTDEIEIESSRKVMKKSPECTDVKLKVISVRPLELGSTVTLPSVCVALSWRVVADV